MTPISGERWRVASSYLDLVLDAPESEQERYLTLLRSFDPTIADDVAELLARHRALVGDRFLEDGPPVPMSSPGAGARVGSYLLKEPIGYGGMGTVWLADRIDGRYEGRAAVKLLNAALVGPAGEARFVQEGTILAKLTHPNIARLVDAGLSPANQAYLVLEYVEGRDIDVFCDAEQLPVEARIRLFLDVLDAVAHAHANLIVHRDLKPKNVLVTSDGQVKLLDFGIAKLLEGAEGRSDVTVAQSSGLTPRYASPEQIRGEAVTTATDVYALGVLLYVLLAGRHPAGNESLSAAELVKSILEIDPKPPSEVAPEDRRRHLAGDLDTIVLKALRKNPAERYQSGSAFADDLRRYLNHQPIAARPDSVGYRAVKFVRRHRLPVTFAAAAFLVVAGLTGYYTAKLAAERDRAELEAQKAARVSELLTGLLTAADPFRTPDAKEVTVRNLLDIGAERIDRELDGQPELKAEMLTVIGRVYARMGLFDKAQPLLEKALPLARAAHVGDHARVAQTLNDLGVLMRDRGDPAGSRPLLEESLAMRRRLLGSSDPDVAITLVELARTYGDLGLTELVEAPIREALAIRKNAFGDEHRETATSKNQLGLLLYSRGQLDEAETLFRENLATNFRLLGPTHASSAIARSNLALVLNAEGRPAEAETLFREAVAMQEKNFGVDDPQVANTLNNLSYPVLDQGRTREARELLERAVRLAKAGLGDTHPRYVTYSLNLARVLLLGNRADIARAESLARHAVDVRTKTLRAGDWRVGQAESLLGAALIARGRAREAEPLLVSAALVLKPIPGPQGREAADNERRLAAARKMISATVSLSRR